MNQAITIRELSKAASVKLEGIDPSKVESFGFRKTWNGIDEHGYHSTYTKNYPSKDARFKINLAVFCRDGIGEFYGFTSG